MHINWGALGTVFAVALVAVVALGSLFSFGVVGLSQREAAREAGGSGTGPLVGADVAARAPTPVVRPRSPAVGRSRLPARR